MLYENIIQALQTIRQNKIRSILTMLGIIIAVWAVVLVVSIGEGVKGQVSSEIDGLGSRLLSVTPGKSITRNDEGEIENFDIAASFTTSALTRNDLDDIKAIPGVAAATPQMLVSGEVKVAKEVVAGALVNAVNEDYPEAMNQKVLHGEFLSGTEASDSIAIIGKSISDEYYSGENPIGSAIIIRNEKFVIKGVMEEFELASSFGGPDINKAVFINLDKGKEFANGNIAIQEIDALVEENADVDEVVKEITAKLKANQGGEENFTILKQEDLLAVTGSIFDLITSGIGLIAGISIVVGSIGIMNIMLVSVTERTREIGLRKAIGAHESQILQQFLIEAVVISLFGGLLGLGLAWLSGLLIELNSDLNPQISLSILLSTLIGSAVIGVASGMWPAVKAARKNAIDALRHE